GKIDVASDPGEGTRFTISLPYVPLPAAGSKATGSPAEPARRPNAAPTSTVPVANALKGARILVADDEPGLVAIVRQLMERSGAFVSVANGGKAALQAIEAAGAQFDVVITDLDMPEVDGWSVAAAVKAHLPRTPVVM